jgi:hypothetical protein
MAKLRALWSCLCVCGRFLFVGCLFEMRLKSVQGIVGSLNPFVFCRYCVFLVCNSTRFPI